MFVSIHIPKCAGTSFRHILQEQCGNRLWLNYGTIFVRSQARRDLVPSDAAWIHGHFFADAFDDLFPDRRLLTWVRHPVERVVSNYHHFLRSPDMRDDCCRALYERRLSLPEFARLDWMRNEASRYLTEKPVSDFAFVGVSERFDDSLRIFEWRFMPGARLASRVDNTNPERRGPGYKLAPEVVSQILELNATDLALYDEAVVRLNGELAEFEACVA
ncbi:MAG TPA: sulfotransferase family 2 domain-containing protein [Opitutaceae bacterium]|nr:sulfotransferase family 2 domain-containing protein [Opitutaceae bacterium]